MISRSDEAELGGKNVLRANTETGMLLLIDPAVLFTRKEWNKIDWCSPSAGTDELIQAIKVKFPQACAFSIAEDMGGDGVWEFVWRESCRAE